MIDHIAARLQALLKHVDTSAQRHTPARPLTETEDRAGASTDASVSRRSRLRRFLYDQWVIAVGSALVVVAVLALIGYLAGVFGGRGGSSPNATQGVTTTKAATTRLGRHRAGRRPAKGRTRSRRRRITPSRRSKITARPGARAA
jgi:hypothetical protein